MSDHARQVANLRGACRVGGSPCSRVRRYRPYHRAGSAEAASDGVSGPALVIELAPEPPRAAAGRGWPETAKIWVADALPVVKDTNMPRTTQLRTYTIREGLLDEWAGKWRDLVVPLRLEL